MPDFKSKYGPWALVAGASEGIGAAFAHAIAQRGVNLILVARRLDKLELLSAEIKQMYNVEIACLALDLADFQTALQSIESLKLEIGLLVYNAAHAPIKYFNEVSDDDLIKIVDVNVKAPLLLAKALSKGMVDRNRGGIVLMSSLAGLQGSPKIATYAASKAFNVVLAEGLWREFEAHNVDVIAAIAGAVRTPGYILSKQNVKEAPGTLDANEVARTTLDALGRGPSVVPGGFNRFAHFLMTRILPRKTAVNIMFNNTKDLE